MTYDPTLIAPYKSGLSKYYKPFLIGNDAFTNLENCYSWRGVIKKREGSTVLGRLAIWATATAITNASPPSVTSVAHGLVTGDMVFLENVVTTNGTVSTITPGTGPGQSTVVTTTGAHGMSSGQTVVITGVTGTIGAAINNVVLLITAITANTMTLSIDTFGLVYTAGGTVNLGALEKQAFQIIRIDPNTFTLQQLNSFTSPAANVPASGVAQSANIYLPIVGTRTFIISSSGNEQLIVFTPKRAFLFNTTTQVFDNISFDTTTAAILWGGTKDNFFYTSNYSTVMWTTNNVFNTTNQKVGIRFFNGSSSAGWADFQPQINATPTYLNSSLLILPFKGRLVALNTTEGNFAANVNVNYFNRARWSQIGTPFVANAPAPFSNDTTSWRDDIVGKGGFIDADTSERIVGAEVIQDTLIVGFQFSTWRLRYTGNDFLPFIWERISTQYGCEATFSTVPFDDYMLEISRRGIVAGSFNGVDRIDLQIPDQVDSFETGAIGEGLNRIQGVRDYQKRLVYWIYGDEANNSQTPNKLLCYNYEDNTWSIFDQSFTTLGAYKLTVDDIWSTWTTIWDGDTTTWDTALDQQNTIMVVAGAVDSRVWQIMNEDVSTDNGTNYNFSITTNLINPYFQQGKRCKLAFYDLYVTNTSNGQVTLENYTDDDPSDPWLIKTVSTNTPFKLAKYVRVFLGMVARNHQITITLSEEQLEDVNIGASDFEIQGIIFHTRMEGRIKQ
jgi:hypothetical protein